jgi:hypothetical protein
VCPAALVGLTVTLLPFTVTSRKWYTWVAEVGMGARPHLLPVRVDGSQPIPYASVGAQPPPPILIKAPPPPPVT